jgi:hypothetical protein
MAMTIDEVCAFARTLPRTNEGLVRGRIKFRIGRIAYLSLSRDGSTMGPFQSRLGRFTPLR